MLIALGSTPVLQHQLALQFTDHFGQKLFPALKNQTFQKNEKIFPKKFPQGTSVPNLDPNLTQIDHFWARQTHILRAYFD